MGIIKEITQPPIPKYSDSPYKGSTGVRGFRELKVGAGNDIMKANAEGLFLGADNFTDAPFSVDYNGSLIASSGTFSGSIAGASGLFAGTMNWSGVAAGTNTKALNVGDGNVKIDGANKRIIINDGTNDRVLIGYDSGGF